MKLTTVLAALLATVVAAKDLQIIKTHEIAEEDCGRKSKVFTSFPPFVQVMYLRTSVEW